MRFDPAPAAEAPLVFVGYGLTIPEMHYDDLAGLDLRGKIAVILSGGPSNIPGALRARCQSEDERNKLLRQHAGVFGIITIQNPKTMDVPWSREADRRFDAAMSPADPAFEQDDELELAVKFNPARAEKLFEGSGHTLKELLAIADSGKPLPRFPIPASLRARVAVERIEGESGTSSVCSRAPIPSSKVSMSCSPRTSTIVQSASPMTAPSPAPKSRTMAPAWRPCWILRARFTNLR
jgi:hypothetical protein